MPNNIGIAVYKWNDPKLHYLTTTNKIMIELASTLSILLGLFRGREFQRQTLIGYGYENVCYAYAVEPSTSICSDLFHKFVCFLLVWLKACVLVDGIGPSLLLNLVYMCESQRQRLFLCILTLLQLLKCSPFSLYRLSQQLPRFLGFPLLKTAVY